MYSILECSQTFISDFGVMRAQGSSIGYPLHCLQNPMSVETLINWNWIVMLHDVVKILNKNCSHKESAANPIGD